MLALYLAKVETTQVRLGSFFLLLPICFLEEMNYKIFFPYLQGAQGSAGSFRSYKEGVKEGVTVTTSEGDCCAVVSAKNKG